MKMGNIWQKTSRPTTSVGRDVLYWLTFKAKVGISYIPSGFLDSPKSLISTASVKSEGVD